MSSRRWLLRAAVGALTALGACGGGDIPWSPSTRGDTVSVSMTLCANPLPAYFAHQNEDQSWSTVAPDANGTFAFNSVTKAAIIYVLTDATGFSTHVVYATAAELSTVALPCATPTPVRTLHGTVTNLPVNADTYVAMGTGSDSGAAFDMTSVPPGALDLVAVARVLTGTDYDVASVIVRRGLNPADNATLPVLDFGSAEAVPTVTNSLTIGGLNAAETTYVRNYFWTPTTQPPVYMTARSGVTTSPQPFASVPASVTLTGDVHTLSVDGWSNGNTTLRAAVRFLRVPTDVSLALGPPVFNPRFTVLSGITPARVLAQLDRQPEYASLVAARYVQVSGTGTWKWDVVMTNGYNPSSTTWSLTMPVTASLPGFPDAGLRGGVLTSVGIEAVSGTLAWHMAVPPQDGDVVRYGFRSSQITTSP
jgi:hypothetical protein